MITLFVDECLYTLFDEIFERDAASDQDIEASNLAIRYGLQYFA